MLDARRDLIVAKAVAEVFEDVDSNAWDPADNTGKRPRKGWPRLLDYFHVAAPGIWSDDAVKYEKGLVDWCGIFALWAIKSAGCQVGTWTNGHGISSVTGMFPTAVPNVGDVGFKQKPHGHMDLIVAVTPDGKSCSTVDGNGGAKGGEVSGPSAPKAMDKTNFDMFYSAFLDSPAGRWHVRVGAWTWFYEFHRDGTANWCDLAQPFRQLGKRDLNHWKIDDSKRQLVIHWQTGAIEHWPLPLRRKGQKGVLLGQGGIITADKVL